MLKMSKFSLYYNLWYFECRQYGYWKNKEKYLEIIKFNWKRQILIDRKKK